MGRRAKKEPMMKPIEIERLLKLLKQPIIAPETEIFLDELGVKRRPYLEPEDIDEGVYNQWLPIRKIGLELEFKHKNNFEKLNAGDMNSADLLLTTLIFYANHEDMRTYPYELPYGLKFDDSPKVVRSKLADKQCSKREYLRDVFEFDDHWLIVSYNNQRNAIDDITYMLISGKKVEAAPASYPVDIEYERLIHSKIDNPILTQLFPFVDFKQYIKNEYTHRDISKLYGIEFTFWKNALVYINLYTTGYLDYSYGFKGPLPFDLTFNDSPSVLRDKIPHQPELWEDDFLQGRAIWIFEMYSLEIIYSTLLNKIAKVAIYPSDFWDDDEDKDGWTVAPFSEL